MKMPSNITGSGTPLVLVPGGLTGWLSWIPFAERLASSRRVVRVQLLSVQLGLDGKPVPEDYSPATEKHALAQTLESNGLTPPVDFAGWSYGGGVVLDFAMDHPDWVRTLTLIEPQAPWALPAPDAEARRQWDEDRRLPRDDFSEVDLVYFLHRAGLVPSETNPRDLPGWPVWMQHRQSLRAVPFIAEYHVDRGRLTRFTAPTLLVKGKESTTLDRQIVDALGDQLPKAQVVELPGDHACHIESMDTFLELMSAFQAGAAERVT